MSYVLAMLCPVTTFDLLAACRELWRLFPKPIRFAIVCGAILIAAIVTGMPVLDVPVMVTLWVAQQIAEKMVQVVNEALPVVVAVPQIF